MATKLRSSERANERNSSEQLRIFRILNETTNKKTHSARENGRVEGEWKKKSDTDAQMEKETQKNTNGVVLYKRNT